PPRPPPFPYTTLFRSAKSRPEPRGRAASRVLSPLVPGSQARRPATRWPVCEPHAEHPRRSVGPAPGLRREAAAARPLASCTRTRSEEHTSELQSLAYL